MCTLAPTQSARDLLPDKELRWRFFFSYVCRGTGIDAGPEKVWDEGMLEKMHEDGNFE